MMIATYMDADDVLRVIDRLASADIRVWVDGGWGVDALLGRQTRRHHDLDAEEAGAVAVIRSRIAAERCRARTGCARRVRLPRSR